MNENLLQELIRLVSLHTGLCVRDKDRQTFGKKIVNRMKALSMTERDYFALLENNGPSGANEWNELAALLTTRESYFFRDSEQFALLGNRILPELVERKGNERLLRIWSAGCASGEEP
jgi:chemotaxis protein methyltransferase CheR